MKQLKKSDKVAKDQDLELFNYLENLYNTDKSIEEVAKDQDLELSNYIKGIEKFAVLSLEEEAELIKKIKTGDQEAFEKLVKANLRIVIPIAEQYQNQNLVLTDLINEGNLGLINAGQTFEQERDSEFKSYAVLLINNFIKQAIAEQARIIRLPINETMGSMSIIGKPYTKFEETSNDC
jgi:RNA polymerase primary sigma factor